MTTYPFRLDEVNLEVFPTDVWQDPLVAFHGTTSNHSPSIEANGFVKSQSPFDLDAARELVRILQLPRVAAYDVPSGFLRMTEAQTLQNYVHAIEHKYFRLSFSYLSLLCVQFATGLSKGGQTVGTIRRTKEILDAAIAEGQLSATDIPQSVTELFNLAENINEEPGVIYAVRLPADLDGITLESNVIYSSSDIPLDCIIGKVIIPETFDVASIDKNAVKLKLQSKLFGAGRIGVLLNRRDNNF